MKIGAALCTERLNYLPERKPRADSRSRGSVANSDTQAGRRETIVATCGYPD